MVSKDEIQELKQIRSQYDENKELSKKEQLELCKNVVLYFMAAYNGKKYEEHFTMDSEKYYFMYRKWEKENVNKIFIGKKTNPFLLYIDRLKGFHEEDNGGYTPILDVLLDEDLDYEVDEMITLNHFGEYEHVESLVKLLKARAKAQLVSELNRSKL